MKFAIVAFILFLAGVCLAADPLNSRRDSLRLYIYQELPADTSGTDLTNKAIVNWAINMAIAATCRHFPAYEKLDTLSIHKTSGEGEPLNSDFLRIYKVHRIKGDTLRVQLLPLSVDTTQPLSKTEADYLQVKDKSTDPAYYYTFNNLFMTQPKVQAATATPDSFLITYYAIAPGIVSDDSVLLILQEYRQAVIWYAVSTLHRRRHRFDLADYYMRLFTSFTAEPIERKELGKE